MEEFLKQECLLKSLLMEHNRWHRVISYCFLELVMRINLKSQCFVSQILFFSMRPFISILATTQKNKKTIGVFAIIILYL